MKYASLKRILCMFLAVAGCALFPAALEAAPSMGDRAPMDQGLFTQSLMHVDSLGDLRALRAYFRHPEAGSLDRVSAYPQIVAALAVEKPYTRRWFALKSLQASAAYDVQAVGIDASMSAYDDVFKHSAEAVTVHAADVVDDTVDDLIAAATRSTGPWTGQVDSDHPGMISEALGAYLVVAANDPGCTVLPNFSEAADLHSDTDKCEQIALDAAAPILPPFSKGRVGVGSLRSPHPSFLVLAASADMIGSTDPDKGRKLFTRAEAALPDTLAVGAAFYARYVAFLQGQNLLPDAIRVQQREISRYGVGRVALLQLYEASNNGTGVDELVASVSDPSVPSFERLGLAKGLLQSAKTTSETDRARSLLRTFADRTTEDPDNRLDAGLAVAYSYVCANDLTSAAAELDRLQLAGIPAQAKSPLLKGAFDHLRMSTADGSAGQ